MITTKIKIKSLLAFMAFGLFTKKIEANHPGGHGGHHQHHSHHSNHQVQNKPFVSSFSHALPGTNSYMSVTRYFNQPSPAVPTHEATRTQVPSTSALSLNDPLNQSSGDNFHPFNPRFEVARIEASDDEWAEQLREVFEESGLLGTQLLKQVPEGMVNLNYDIHICVHMGTELTPEESAYPPTVSYPEEGASANKLHTLVLLDAELNKLHWMVIDIPGAKVHKGKTITSYAGPNPAENTGTHRYIVLVMEQPSPINVELVTDYKTETSCQTQDLESFDLTNFQENLNLSEPVAANYFIQRFSPFVENINGHCLLDVPIQPHPLYK